MQQVGVGGWQWIKGWAAWGVYGLQGEVSLHTLQGWLPAFNSLPQLPPPPPSSQLRTQAPSSPAPLPSLPPQFSLPPLLPPFPPRALQTSTLFENSTLYCRVSQRSMLHLSGHIQDCAKAVGEQEGVVEEDHGQTFSWDIRMIRMMTAKITKIMKTNTFVRGKTPWGLVDCFQNQSPGSHPEIFWFISCWHWWRQYWWQWQLNWWWRWWWTK